MVGQALRLGIGAEEIHEACKIDPWFIARIAEIVALENKVREFGLPKDAENLRMLKVAGFSDARLATLAKREESDVRAARHALGVRPVYQAHRHLRGGVRLAHRLYVFDL